MATLAGIVVGYGLCWPWIVRSRVDAAAIELRRQFVLACFYSTAKPSSHTLIPSSSAASVPSASVVHASAIPTTRRPLPSPPVPRRRRTHHPPSTSIRSAKPTASATSPPKPILSRPSRTSHPPRRHIPRPRRINGTSDIIPNHKPRLRQRLPLIPSYLPIPTNRSNTQRLINPLPPPALAHTRPRIREY